MSAGDRWHERGAVKDGDPAISSAVLLWMSGQGEVAQATLPWEADPEGAFRPEPGVNVGIEDEDVLGSLLQAIENTDIAARFQNVPPPEIGDPFAEISQPPAPNAEPQASVERAPGAAEEVNEALAILLRALDSTKSAVNLEGLPRAESAEAAQTEASLAAVAAETVSLPVQAPEAVAEAITDAAQPAPDAVKLPEASLPAVQSADANLNLNAAPPQSDAESGQVAFIAPLSAAAIVESPARPQPSTSKQESRQPKRAARRRRSGRQRSDYLLAMAAPTAALPIAEAEPQFAEPAPAAAAEPEQPVAARPAAMTDAPPAAVAPTAPILARLGTGLGSIVAKSDLINVGLDRAEMRLENWFQKWFAPPDPRHDVRVQTPPLVAYHWIVDFPQAIKVANIGAGGLHLITKDRWSEGNIVSMTLQRTDMEKGSPDSWIAVDFLVMRWCEDGMAGAFLPAAPGLAYTVAGRAGNCADKKTLERFVGQLMKATANRADRVE